MSPFRRPLCCFYSSVPPCDECTDHCVELLFLPLVAGSARINANRLLRGTAVTMGRRRNLPLICFLVFVVFRGKNLHVFWAICIFHWFMQMICLNFLTWFFTRWFWNKQNLGRQKWTAGFNTYKILFTLFIEIQISYIISYKNWEKNFDLFDLYTYIYLNNPYY